MKRKLPRHRRPPEYFALESFICDSDYSHVDAALQALLGMAMLQALGEFNRVLHGGKPCKKTMVVLRGYFDRYMA